MKRVADFENITVDKAYEMPILQFLNDLSYLKEKEAHDLKQYKDAANSE